MKPSLINLLVRWLVLALGVTLATKLVHGIRCDDNATLIGVVVLLSLFNAVLRPILVLFALPFIVLTLGLGLLIINAILFYWVGKMIDGFHVADFWAALWGALIVSLTNMVLGAFLRSPPRPPSGPGRKRGGGDVIDI